MTAPIPGDALYYVDAQCPQCGQATQIPLHIAARLEKVKGEAKLGLKVTQKKQDHVCGQTSLAVVSETGEIVQLGWGDGR